MDPLRELLDSLRGSDLAGLSRDEAQQHLDEIREAVADVDVATASDDDLAALEEAAQVVTDLSARIDTLDTEAAERAERAAAAIERIVPTDAADESDEPGDEPEAEADVDADADADEAEVEAEVDADEAEVDEPEPVTAAAKKAPPLARVAARRPKVAQPAKPAERPVVLTASANVPGIPAGEVLDTPAKVSKAFVNAFESVRGAKTNGQVKIPVITASAADDYEDRFRLDGSAYENRRKIDAAVAKVQAEGGIQQAITASGGVCSPAEVRYDLPGVGIEDRPVRDGMMTRFAATRGGVQTMPIPTLLDDTFDGAVDVWTEANDQSPSDPATKPCLTVTCDAETETLVDAITKCLQFGNFRARFWPEQIDEWTRLAAVQHAREAETQLLTTIGTGSTAVTSGENLSATRDVLTTIDRAAAQMRNRHRMAPSAPLRFAAPAWLKDMIRTDLAREQPGSSDERLAVADATIQSFFSVRNINVTWFLDGETGQVYATQGAGALLGWTSTVITYLYPDGTWLFLDGGTLDLGIIRDSTLTDTNDYRMFSETFEGAHFHGVESLRITMDICPDGATSASVAFDPCSIGS